MKCLQCGHALDAGIKFCPECGTRAGEAPTADPLLGRTLNGKYRVLSELGAGAMGTVYRGEHVGLKKPVALKVLHPDLGVSEETIQRFQQEGIAAGRFTHPGAIQIFDIDRADERTFYLAMEYVEGRTLKQVLRDEGPLAPAAAVALVRQVLSVLAAAHRQGIVHRDLKPENIMVVEGEGGERAVKVLDFGLSKLVHQPLEASLRTQTGRILGTPLYMAPEQCSGGDVDHRADLYATGLVLYELLSGKPPFEGESLTEILVKHSTEAAPSLAESRPDLAIPTDLDEVVDRALAKRREDRWQTAGEMLAALDEVRYEELAGRRRSRRAGRSSGGRSGAGRARASRAGVGRAGASAGPTPGQRTLRRVVVGGLALVLAVALALALTIGRGDGEAEAFARVRQKPAEQRTEEEARYVALLDEARRALRERAADAALASLTDALELGCRDAEAYTLRAEVYRQRDDADTALADLREALALDPTYAAAQAAIGWIAYERGDEIAALEAFEEAAGIDPDAPEALAGQAAVLLERGEREGARELLERAVQASADDARAQALLGRMRLDDGDVEGAIAAFVQAKRADPRSARAYAGHGEAYLAQESWDEAETQLRRALELAPDTVEPRVQLAALLVVRERWSDARSQLEAALSRHPEEPRFHALLGAVLVESDAGEAALERLRRAVELGAADARTHLLLGTELQRAGRAAEGLEALDAALAVDPSLGAAHLARGLALLDLGRAEEAAAALEAARDAGEDTAFVHGALGVVYMDWLGDVERAAESFERARELDPSDPRFAERLARLGR